MTINVCSRMKEQKEQYTLNTDDYVKQQNIL